MASRTVVASSDDLLRLLKCADISEVAASVVSRTSLCSDSAVATVKPSGDGVDVRLKTMTSVERGFDVDFPFTVTEFWQAVEEIDRYLADDEAENLPYAGTDDDGSTDEDRTDLIATLGWNWRLHHSELVEIVGGGWRSIPVRENGVVLDDEGDLADPQPVWLGSGDPLLVAIGVTGSYVWVGAPTTIPLGMHGPEYVQVDIDQGVLRTEPNFFLLLSSAIAATIKATRRRMKICWGCRQLKPAYQKRENGVVYCRDCMTIHFGLIID